MAIRDYYAPALIGHPATDIAGAHGGWTRRSRRVQHGDAAQPGWIDIALHDLVGRARAIRCASCGTVRGAGR